jgi:hypothetical protein
MATTIIVFGICVAVIAVVVIRFNRPPDIEALIGVLRSESEQLARSGLLTGEQSAEVRAAIVRAHPQAAEQARAAGYEAARPSYRRALALALKSDGTVDRVYRSAGIFYDLVPGVRLGEVALPAESTPVASTTAAAAAPVASPRPTVTPPPPAAVPGASSSTPPPAPAAAPAHPAPSSTAPLNPFYEIRTRSL